MTTPALIAVAHGSADPAAQLTVRALARLVQYQAPELDVRVAFAAHAEPALPGVLAAAGRGAVVVPLLLSTGYHASVDIAGAALAAGASMAAPLGPGPRLADALADRLARAGVPAGTATVLAAAGSADPRALAAVWRQARLLAARTGAPVLVGFASAARPTVTEAIDALSGPSGRPVAVASYLLSPGLFYDRLKRSGARWVSEPLGCHPAVASLVIDRFRAAARNADPCGHRHVTRAR
ncbi:MAG TPA: sirohydrochlorin chelatase [Streptosporangiaceae bacterium]|jgi:sirohydrochlorin ferrochelatase